jgi:hypothetical protein
MIQELRPVRLASTAAFITAATIFVPGLDDIRHIALVFFASILVLGLVQAFEKTKLLRSSPYHDDPDPALLKRRVLYAGIAAGTGALIGSIVVDVFWPNYGWAGAGLGALIGCNVGYWIADKRGSI